MQGNARPQSPCVDTAELVEFTRMLIRIPDQCHAGMFRMIYARMEIDRGVAGAGDGGV